MGTLRLPPVESITGAEVNGTIYSERRGRGDGRRRAGVSSGAAPLPSRPPLYVPFPLLLGAVFSVLVEAAYVPDRNGESGSNGEAPYSGDDP
jgi:hypothetical protein